MIKSTKAIVFLLVISSSQLFAGDSIEYTEELKARATKLMQQFAQKSGAPVLSVSVGYQGRIVWSKGFGYADLEQMVPVNPSLTKFRVGSVAKPFTAFALAKLLESKKIAIDSEIQDYVSSFPIKKFPITV